MKTIVAGSRSITSYDVVRKAIEASGWIITEVVSGGAPGVDRLGERWANENGILVRVFPAQWETLGKRAGPERNREMGAYADRLIAIWDGKSKGTKNMLDTMGWFGKPTQLTVVT